MGSEGDREGERGGRKGGKGGRGSQYSIEETDVTVVRKGVVQEEGTTHSFTAALPVLE